MNCKLKSNLLKHSMKVFCVDQFNKRRALADVSVARKYLSNLHSIFFRRVVIVSTMSPTPGKKRSETITYRPRKAPAASTCKYNAPAKTVSVRSSIQKISFLHRVASSPHANTYRYEKSRGFLNVVHTRWSLSTLKSLLHDWLLNECPPTNV